MNKVRQKWKVFFLSLVAFSFFSASAFAGPKDHAGAQVEVWELQISGDTEGKCDLFLKRSETEKDVYFVTGKFSGKIEDTQWGAGRLDCKLTGKTRKSDFSIDWKGFANMQDGDAADMSLPVTGKAKGSLTESEGSGTWSCTHEWGMISGKWTVKKIRGSQ